MEEFKRKRGRPRINIPRNNPFLLMLSDEERELLRYNSEKNGKSQAEFLREIMLLNSEPIDYREDLDGGEEDWENFCDDYDDEYVI